MKFESTNLQKNLILFDFRQMMIYCDLFEIQIHVANLLIFNLSNNSKIWVYTDQNVRIACRVESPAAIEREGSIHVRVMVKLAHPIIICIKVYRFAQWVVKTVSKALVKVQAFELSNHVAFQ